jgi:hypothetical protein
LTSAPRRPRYIRSGFLLAFALRLLTASLAIVIPLYATSVLGATPAGAGVFVVLLWVGNAAGVIGATIAIRDQSWSSVVGFLVLAMSMLGLAARAEGIPAPFEVLTAGVGMGLPQPFLSAFMHLDSDPQRPISGLGLYSTALGIGLVLGPILAYGALARSGFPGVLVALSAVCVLGMAGAVAGHGGLVGKPKPPIPSPRKWLESLGGGAFRRAFVVNLLYSLLLPLFLSYGAIYAESRFGFTPESALILFTAVFLVSTTTRFLTLGVGKSLGRLLLVSVVLLFASTLCLGLAPSWPFFVLGMVLFSLPHALVFPITTYVAFSSVRGAEVINASYVFQTSSGVAELLSPAMAVVLIPFVGVQGIFLVGALMAGSALAITALGRVSATPSPAPFHK